jgi:hypothetical protein
VAGLIALCRRGELPADAPVLVNLTGADRPRSPVPQDVIAWDDALVTDPAAAPGRRRAEPVLEGGPVR